MSTYDLYKNKSYNLRLPAEIKAKFEIIAEKQGYKKTSHAYLDVISNYVKAYELQYGEIKLEQEEPTQQAKYPLKLPYSSKTNTKKE